MEKFIINGGKKLNGEVEISGAKNAVLKMMAASVLTNEICVLDNVPKIDDVIVMEEILQSIGAKTKWLSDHKLQINPKNINSYKPNSELFCKMRSSIILAGPILARFGKAEIARAGGCVIGARPVSEHWDAIKKFGVKIVEKKDHTYLSAEKNKLIGNKIILDAMSVTATENVLMSAVLTKGITEIRVAACEPEIQDLVKMLNSMGAKITGEKTHCIKIVGVNKLKGFNHKVITDRMQAVTYAIAAIITQGNVKIKNIIPDHLDIVFNRFDKAGINYKLSNQKGDYTDLQILPSNKLHPIKIDARPYPGYPTDIQAPTAVLMTQLPKTSKIFETIFEGRLKYLEELKKMGAKVKILDSHTAEISGPTKLHGAKITSFDLRAGATLILAGLIAKGTTEIDNISTIDRGYEDIDGKLRKLGADIRRVNV